MDERNRTARWIMIGLSLIGLLDSTYLTYIKLAHRVAACAGIGDCETVNASVYSEIHGIPIALLGAGAYLVLLFLLIMEPRGEIWAALSAYGVFGITLTGVIYSAYLTYIEVAVLHAVCPFCVLSAVVMVLLLLLASLRLIAPE